MKFGTIERIIVFLIGFSFALFSAMYNSFPIYNIFIGMLICCVAYGFPNKKDKSK